MAIGRASPASWSRNPRRMPIRKRALIGPTQVELFQLTGLPRAWAIAFPPIALVLGTGFDVRDVVVYAGTVIVTALADVAIVAGAGRHHLGERTPTHARSSRASTISSSVVPTWWTERTVPAFRACLRKTRCWQGVS